MCYGGASSSSDSTLRLDPLALESCVDYESLNLAVEERAPVLDEIAHMQ